MAISYKVSEDSSRFVEPDGEAEIDVVNNMAWTKTPKSGRKDIPWAYMREYQMQKGQLVSSILYWARIYQQVGLSGQLIYDVNDPADVYKYKYFAKKTGFSYKFPYFNPKKHSRKTDFGYEDGKGPLDPLLNLGSSIAQYGGFRNDNMMSGGLRNNIGKWAGVVPVLGQSVMGLFNTAIPGKIELEHPQSWVGTSEGQYSITFDLSNTGTIADISDNRNLCYILTHNNSGSRRTFAIMDPSVIYDLYIPDVVSLPACYIDNLDITNLGNTRVVKINNIDRIVPEAYRISMSITSLLLPSRNILMGLDSGQPVVTIGNESDVESTLNPLLAPFQNGGSSSSGDLSKPPEIDRGAIRPANPLLPNSTPLRPI